MRRITVLATVLALALVGLATPTTAVAQTTDNLACPPGSITPAGFTDVDPNSAHSADIDCIAWYEITAGTSPTTFDPKGSVTRWQMAIFLIRTYDAIKSAGVDGSDQGFTDIAGLSSEAQKAINMLKQLSITSGTSPTTFSPHGAVTRWEMALFLTRLLRADGVSSPDGSDQGFTDISGFGVEAQKAINQMKQLGITTGTTPTTFVPVEVVTREQMATFLARTLNADGTIFTPPRSLHIVDLIAEGAIKATLRGAGIDDMELDLENLLDELLDVEIPAGTYFVAGSGGVQNMVVRTGKTVELESNQLLKTLLDVVCANLQRDIPEENDTFTVERQRSDQTSRLMRAIDDSNERYDVAQAATWIVSDDANYGDLGILITFPSQARVIDEAEAGRAMQLVDGAGIDIKTRAIWGDRNTIAAGAGAAFQEWIAGL